MPELVDAPNLVIEGLMTVGRLAPTADEARPTFLALRALSERLRDRWPALGDELSMGMSDDFEAAIEEGLRSFGSAGPCSASARLRRQRSVGQPAASRAPIGSRTNGQ